jgi:hypothetical protein
MSRTSIAANVGSAEITRAVMVVVVEIERLPRLDRKAAASTNRVARFDNPLQRLPQRLVS